MTAGALLVRLLLLSGPAESDLERLADPSREIRERAVESLAVRGPATSDLLPLLEEADARRAALVAAVLERRGDAAALPALLALAGAAEGVRGRAAARALVSLAFAGNLPLEAMTAAQGSLARERIAEAVAGAVERLLGRLGHAVSQDRPQEFRAVHAGGAMSERALRGLILREGAGALRAAALFVHLVHTDGATGPLAATLLDDADARVRAAAASCVLATANEQGLERLAEAIDEEQVEAAMLRAVFEAVRRTRRTPGPTGLSLLESALRTRPMHHALAAASALKALAPERFGPALRARVERHLLSEGRQAGAGIEAALYHLECGPLPEDLEARFAASGTPLLAAAVACDSAEVVAILGGLLSPAVPIGGKEFLRVRIVHAILNRTQASFEARVAFAASTLHSDSALIRRYGISLLRNAPEEAIGPIRPRLLLALTDTSEEVRLRAATLVGPTTMALQVLLDSLYDGATAHAAEVAQALARYVPDWPAVDPKAPVAERRALALQLRKRIVTPMRDPPDHG